MENHRKRAISPVVASIVLIAVTVSVCIVVAAWTGNDSVAPFEKIVFINFGSEYIRMLVDNNITTFHTDTKPLDIGWLDVGEGNFSLFLDQCKTKGVKYVLTDYKPFQYPRITHRSTLYQVEAYTFWFYEELPSVGRVAISCPLTVGAYWSD